MPEAPPPEGEPSRGHSPRTPAAHRYHEFDNERGDFVNET